jgi:endoglucanase
MKKNKGNQPKAERRLPSAKSRRFIMKYVLIVAGLLCGFLPANAALPSGVFFREIRTASSTELALYYVSTNVTGPVYGTVYSTNQIVVGSPSSWTLNGVAATAGSEFVTESGLLSSEFLTNTVAAVDYHFYLQFPPLTNGVAYTLVTPYGTTNFVFEDTNILCESIKVNQNGYSALSDTRYANFAIWLGTGGAQQISGPLPTYTVFDQFTGQEVASGTLQQFGGGTKDTSSGDYVYRIDLSGVPAGGPYQISVSGIGCSYPFGVGGNFAQRLAYVAFRGLLYQRCGVPLIQPYVHANIRPYGCHTNIYDDQAAINPDSTPVNTSSPELDVHGSYHDAGDSQRNVWSILVPITPMTTYEVFPSVFTGGQFNIPENFDANFNILPGTNGIPDILNEAMWGVMFWTNMQSTSQEPAGAVAWGTSADAQPIWYINWDQDTLKYGTETNNADSCGLAAGTFMNMARLIQPYNYTLSTNLAARGVAAYAAAGSGITMPAKLYYWIQEYLLNGDATASNNIQSLYTQVSAYTNSYNDEAGGFATSGNEFLASEFMSYIIATNVPTNPTTVSFFKTILQAAANREIGYLTNDAYPCGWPTNANPYTQYNFFSGPFTSQGQYAYPCLMEWALTGQQQYIDAVSVLMDYDQGLNPLGKSYLTGIGFNQVHNPHQGESVYAQEMGWGGPQPGITVYGPGTSASSAGNTAALQLPSAGSLPRERLWVDDLGDYEWTEFTPYQCFVFPAAIYPVLAQGVTWQPAAGEPFLNPNVSINSATNGLALQFGGIPGQFYVVQSASAVTGPWSNLSGPLEANPSGIVSFTDTNAPSATLFYRTQGQAPIY